MDSLTQIVLGAACGEATLGKKIGNKALLFGAIGGTIPDLDVFTGPWIYGNEIDIMASHRGFSHSILFSILGAFLFGYVVHWLYNRGKRKNTTLVKDWIWLFFLALFTHIVLDSFTPYGTQWFLPFSDYRVAFNNISVVDPLYTAPFLICLVVLMFFKRNTKKRSAWLNAGLLMSTAYMIYTLGVKFHVDALFEKSLKVDNISYDRFRLQPSIFNSVLWYGIAEDKNNYHVSYYSLLDEEAKFTNWLTLPKNHELLPLTHSDIETLAWFSDDYFNVLPTDVEGSYRYNDLRYPMLNSEDPNSSVFSFTVFKDDDRWNIKPFSGKPPTKEDLQLFFDRVKGIKSQQTP